MDKIILSGKSVAEIAAFFNEPSLSCDRRAVFVTFFEGLTVKEQSDFVRSFKKELSALVDAEILGYLCAKGYFCFLYPYMRYGERADTLDMFERYYGPRYRMIRFGPTYQDEILIMKLIASDMKAVCFLREKTRLFWGEESSHKVFRRIIYENTSVEVLDYLVSYAAKAGLSVCRSSGYQMFLRASPSVIRSYISRVACFSSSIFKGIGFAHIEALYQRTDLSRDVKTDLIFYAINRFKVSPQTITKMRKVGMFD